MACTTNFCGRFYISIDEDSTAHKHIPAPQAGGLNTTPLEKSLYGRIGANWWARLSGLGIAEHFDRDATYSPLRPSEKLGNLGPLDSSKNYGKIATQCDRQRKIFLLEHQGG